MKKQFLLLLLLATAYAQGQTTLANKLKITGNVTDNAATKVNVQDATGLVNTIAKADLIDVLEYPSAINLPVTGVFGKIYVTLDNGKIYRWNTILYQELAVTDISGKVDKNAPITAGTKTKITYDAKGLVTSGTDLVASDIPTIAQSQVTNLTTDLATKVDKVAGKGLSTEDYTTAEKDKLAGIQPGATANSTDAQLRDRSTHTGTQLASTISDFTSAARTSVVDNSITDGIIDKAPSQNAVYDALQLKTDKSSTSIKTGCVISVGSGSGLISVSPGTFVIADNSTGTTVLTPVTFSGVTDVAAIYPRTILYITSSGTLIQFNGATGDLSPAQRRQNLFIGTFAFDGVNVLAIQNTPNIDYDISQRFNDLTQTLGVRNSEGNVLTANGANLMINKTSGRTFRHMSNYQIDKNIPDITTDNAAIPIPSGINLLAYRNGLGGWSYESYSGSITPTFWDDGTGVKATVANNKFTIPRVYFFNGTDTYIVYLGQKEYGSIDAAIGDANRSDRVIDPATSLSSYRGGIVVEKSVTDLQAGIIANIVRFIAPPSNGSGVGSGTVSTQNLQGVYNNSVNPEITTDAVRGAFTVRNGQVSDASSVLEGQNIAGSTTFSVTGNGDITGNTYNGYVPEDVSNKVTDIATGANDITYPTSLSVDKIDSKPLSFVNKLKNKNQISYNYVERISDTKLLIAYIYGDKSISYTLTKDVNSVYMWVSEIKHSGIDANGKALYLTGEVLASNVQEFAIRYKKSGTTDTDLWLPYHGVGSSVNTFLISYSIDIDGIKYLDFNTLPLNQSYIFEEISLRQKIGSKYSLSDLTNQIEVDITTVFNSKQLNISNEYEILSDIDINRAFGSRLALVGSTAVEFDNSIVTLNNSSELVTPLGGKIYSLKMESPIVYAASEIDNLISNTSQLENFADVNNRYSLWNRVSGQLLYYNLTPYLDDDVFTAIAAGTKFKSATNNIYVPKIFSGNSINISIPLSEGLLKKRQMGRLLHTNTNESFTGIKSSINTTSSFLNGIDLTSSGSSGSIAMRIGVTSSGTGYRSNVTGSGFGIFSVNTGVGYSLYSLLSGVANGIYSLASDSSKPIVSNGDTSFTGFVYSGQNSGVNTFTVDKLGNITGNNFSGSGTVTASPATVDTELATLGQVNLKEPIISPKNTAFNKNFGTTTGTIAEGNDSRILNGQTAFSWGDHRQFGLGLASGGAGVVLPSDNLNLTTTPSGSYRTTSITTGIPLGVTNSGSVRISYSVAGYPIQLFQSLGTGLTFPRLFIRNYDSVAMIWKDWEELAKTNSPSFTGTPTAPTATAGTNTTQIATTAFVTSADSGNVKLTGNQNISGSKIFETGSNSVAISINNTGSSAQGFRITNSSTGAGMISYGLTGSTGDVYQGGLNAVATFRVNKEGDITGNKLTLTGVLKLKAYTVGSLPTGAVGDMAYVTDATAPTYNGTLTGGGSVVCPVFYNGTAWVSH